MRSNKGKKLTVVDLFAGAGGLLLGFEQAGFETVSANEIDEKAIEMLKFNYPWVKVNEKSIEDIRGQDLLFGYKVGEIDVVVGGPPCQGFSLIGLRDHTDPRNKLVSHFIRIVDEIKPKTFMMENVPGMLSTQKGAFVKKLLEEFDRIGYEVNLPVQILNADDFGVPQRRSRVIVIGVRKDLNLKVSYPKPTYKSPRNKKAFDDLFSIELPSTPTVKDAIFDLPQINKYKHLIDHDDIAYERDPISNYAKIMRGYLNDPLDLSAKPPGWDPLIVTGCKRTIHGPVLEERCRTTPAGQSLPVSRLFKLGWDGIANTLRAGTPRERGAYSSPRPIHPSQPRVISVREGARLQSFPDWIRFHPTKWHGFRQVGNSVCPLLARAIAYEFKKALS